MLQNSFQLFCILLTSAGLFHSATSLQCLVGGFIEKCEPTDWIKIGQPTCYKFEYMVGNNRLVTRGCDRTGHTCKLKYGLPSQNTCRSGGVIKGQTGATACCCNDRDVCNTGNRSKISVITIIISNMLFLIVLCLFG